MSQLDHNNQPNQHNLNNDGTRSAAQGQDTANTQDAVIERIKKQISSHPVLLYMKGNPLFPNCGFSARVAHILGNLSTEYAYVNILENPDIRATLPVYANWPTFPQLYIQGELIGGCDIVTELHASKELEPLLRKANAIKETEKPKFIDASK
jgi:monothiol glutaredoxin